MASGVLESPPALPPTSTTGKENMVAADDNGISSRVTNIAPVPADDKLSKPKANMADVPAEAKQSASTPPSAATAAPAAVAQVPPQPATEVASTPPQAPPAATAAASAAAAETPAVAAQEPQQPDEEEGNAQLLAASTPAKPVRLRPALRGVLRRDAGGTVRWEGKWGMDDSAFDGGVLSAFSYARVRVMDNQDSNDLPPEAVLSSDALGSDALSNAIFQGHFFMMMNGRSRKINEKDVLFEFCADESLPPSVAKVRGSGVNQFGQYTLEGTLVLKTGELNVYREYPARVVAAPPPRRAAAAARPKKSAAAPRSVAKAPPKPRAPSKALTAALTPDQHLLPSRNQRMRRAPSHLVEDMLDDREAEDLIKLKNIVREVMRADREGWFAAPVDHEALGLVGYTDIVTRPMDLGTVLKKFDHKEYRASEEAIEDVRLTFNNAISYNPDGHGVNTAARRLLAQFEQQLNKLSSVRQQAAKKRKKGGKPGKAGARSEDDTLEGEDDEDDFAVDKSRAKKRTKKGAEVASDDVHMLRKKVEEMNQMIQLMQQNQAAGFQQVIAHGSVLGAHQTPANPASKPRRNNESRPLSYQEKRQLGQDINKLPGDMIEGVIRIIQESGTVLGGEESDEVELDIEALDTPSLRKLQRYVKKCLSKARSKKGREEQY